MFVDGGKVRGDIFHANWDLIIHRLISLFIELCLSFVRLATQKGVAAIEIDRASSCHAQLKTKIFNQAFCYGTITDYPKMNIVQIGKLLSNPTISVEFHMSQSLIIL